MNGKKEKKPLEFEDGGEKKDEGGSGSALGIRFGCCFGLLVQVITGDIIWLPIGVAVGFGLGFAFGDRGRKRD